MAEKSMAAMMKQKKSMHAKMVKGKEMCEKGMKMCNAGMALCKRGMKMMEW